MKKRRIFDLDMPEDLGAPTPVPAPTPAPVTDAPAGAAPAAGETFPAGKVAPETKSAFPPRRGPMATAVQENAEALKARAVAEAAIRAENDALATEFVRLKGLGLIVDMIPLEAIDTAKLVRDRASGRDLELDELKTSIREIGLSNPIRVEPRADGRYELVQGLRRLTAYRELHAETGDARYARIPAGLMTDGRGLDDLYRRMVDENLVRKDISFAEMAELARSYAADPRTACDDVDKAVSILFQSAGYQKRSYIRAFAGLLDRLGEALVFPQDIPRNLGLELKRQIDSGARRCRGHPQGFRGLGQPLGTGRAGGIASLGRGRAGGRNLPHGEGADAARTRSRPQGEGDVRRAAHGGPREVHRRQRPPRGAASHRLLDGGPAPA